MQPGQGVRGNKAGLLHRRSANSGSQIHDSNTSGSRYTDDEAQLVAQLLGIHPRTTEAAANALSVCAQTQISLALLHMELVLWQSVPYAES